MSTETTNRHMIRLKLFGLKTWAEAFIRDCKVRELSPFTIEYYRAQLEYFLKFCDSLSVSEVTQIDPDLLRAYLLQLEATGHNAGGRNAKYRALRAFLLWWEREAEPEAWTNPLLKVRPPKMPQKIIEPVPLADIKAMMKTCGGDFTGARDKAILLCLLDTGARAREFLSLNLDDVDFIGGGVVIRKGKGNKPRIVFIGRQSRKILRAYLKLRDDTSPAVWVTKSGERLAVTSLRGIFERRAKAAGVAIPSAHDFRRAFAIAMIRAGVDVFTLQRLMGHESLDVLKRYLALVSDDLRNAHEKASPVDGML